MLYTELTNIYAMNSILKVNYPLEEYYPLLRQFIVKESRMGSTYFVPERFAYDNGLSVDKSRELFLGLSSLSNDRIFMIKYKWKCEVCGNSNYIDGGILGSKDINKDIFCSFCGELFEWEDIGDLKVLFTMRKDILDAMKAENSSKSSSSLSIANVREGDLTFEQSQKILSNQPSINPKLSDQQQAQIDRVNSYFRNMRKGNGE